MSCIDPSCDRTCDPCAAKSGHALLRRQRRQEFDRRVSADLREARASALVVEGRVFRVVR